MTNDFTHATLGKTDLRVHRLGLSATYRPGKATIHRALDEGLNYFFAFNIDTQMVHVLREVMPSQRERYVLATGAYNLMFGYPNLRRTLEKRLRQFRTDYIDVFLFLGVTKEKEFPERAREELRRFREEGKVRALGMSTHDRKFAGKLASEDGLDVLMIRYNAAHRGAEEDVFPYLEAHHPGVVSYTATRWTYLTRRPHVWPKAEPIPTPGMCYRFALSNPHVDVCMTAPSNLKQFEENLRAVREGPLCEEERVFMRRFGDVVPRTAGWFM